MFHHYDISQRPLDHLFPKSRISRQHTWKIKNHNSGKFEFLFIWFPHTSPVGKYGSICLYYRYFIIMGSHRSLMIILFQSRASGGNICRESWKTTIPPNSSFFFNGEPNYVTSWVIWVYLFTIYALHYNGITQRPRDHLFQISGVWVRYVPRKLVTKNGKLEFLL